MMKHVKFHTNRIFAVILVLATLITSLPFTAIPVFSEQGSLQPEILITKDGKEIQNLNLSEYDKITLTAESNVTDNAGYCWQICDPYDDERWINITGETFSEISVTYALIGSMLDADATTKIRCLLTVAGEVYTSKAVTIEVSYSVVYDTESAPVGDLIGMGSVNLLNAGSGNSGSESYVTYSVVINYLFDNGAMAFEPYGASVAKGSDFVATVTSPKVVGYAPYRRVGEDYVEADTVELNYTNIQSDITINIIYEPALVNFSVHHHLQNLLDDDYSNHYDLITTGKAFTGTQVPAGLDLTSEQLPGFKALAYERLAVAADGSTVIEIRYDRNYYLIDFDMAGGYGVEPVYTRYGMTLGANQPIRHGYVFGGWELVSYDGNTPTNEQASLYDINSGRQIQVPDANLRYRAIWITQQTTYTMVFWQENADDSGYSYWGYLDELPALSGDYVSGQDWISRVSGIDDDSYFKFNSEKTDKNVLVEGDGSTVVNVYYTRNYYKLTIKAKGKCTLPTQHQHSDACYDRICDKGHIHTEGCAPELICDKPVHVQHTDECMNCGMVEHLQHTAQCCGDDEHTHTISCWKNIGKAAGNLKNAPSNPSQGQIYYTNRKYYIYIKGTWYNYSGYGPSSGDIVLPNCGYSKEHTHGNNDCGCTLEIHVHSNLCYRDVIHSHLDTCYSYSCNEIEHEHVDECYRLKCGLTENHSHSNTCNNSDNTNITKIIYRKYNQSIEDIWPITDDNGVIYNSGQRWKPSDSSYYSQVLVYISSMPADDFVLTLDVQNYTAYTMQYYMQVLPGDPYEVEYNGNYYILDNTIMAKYNYITKNEDFFDIKGFYQYASSPSFNSSGQIDINTNNPNDYIIKFYYNRNSDYVLEFDNNGNKLNDKRVTNIVYGASLKQYDFVPDYPSNLEPNAYTFGGWYTTPQCFDGTEVNWDTLTMSDGNLLLYAKWAPVKHTVNIFTDATLSEQIGVTQLVDHKAYATAPASIPQNGNLVFQGWFYTDVVNGEVVEKAFVFTGIPVLQDLNVYAKWSSHVSVNYTIHYVLKGTNTKIADSLTGTAIAGHNKTFNAKADVELYEGYRTGYYPLANSHTITMSVDGTHEYTFEYVYVESMPYLVRYINIATGEEVLQDKYVEDNTLSVVTETFVRVNKMMPDAYQKRLVLTASGNDQDKDGVYDENVITFYYKSDEVNAYYRVVHYIQNIAGDSYREYRHEEMVGVIGTTYTVNSLSLIGFTFNKGKTLVNGKPVTVTDETVSHVLGEEGMLIELYYDRIDVNYTIRYLESGSDKQLIADKKGTAIYGSQISEYARDLTLSGYTLYSDNLKTLVLSANDEHNVIIFYYTQATVSIKYQIVGSNGCGTLSQYSENVLALDGQLNGSIPTVMPGYRFVGWYSDIDCREEIDTAWIDSETNKLKPKKADNAVWVDGTTFYAKFEADTTDMNIVKSGISSNDAYQASIFRVEGVSGTKTEGIDITLTIIGNGTATLTGLPIGEYVVTELTEWSWRYNTADAVKNISLSVDKSMNTVSFHNVRAIEQWLDGNAFCNNVFYNS